mgnify:CR=1 FL=1
MVDIREPIQAPTCEHIKNGILKLSAIDGPFFYFKVFSEYPNTSLRSFWINYATPSKSDQATEKISPLLDADVKWRKEDMEPYLGRSMYVQYDVFLNDGSGRHFSSPKTTFLVEE